MSLEELKVLSNQQAAINRMFLKDRLSKIGLEEKLNEMYKPLLESSKSIEKSAEKNTEKIINKLEEKSNKESASLKDNLDEIKDLLANFPNVIATLRGEDVFLTPQDISVMEAVGGLEPKSKKRLFTDVVRGSPKESPKESPKVRAKEIPKDIKDMMEIFTGSNKKEIEKIINDEEKMNKLLQHAVNSDIKNEHFTRSEYYRAIDDKKKGFLQMVKDTRLAQGIHPTSKSSVKKSKEKTGTGLISFLPSTTGDLLNEINRLLGSYKAGNKNTFNEISAISDVLRRRGVISPELAKQLYKHLM
jgi:hypothetical protein